MSRPKITPEISAVLKRLIREFPQCFKSEAQTPLPLAHGIHWELLAVTHPDTPPLVIRDALRIYTNRPSYQACLKPGATRVNLQGEPAGTVDAPRPPQPAKPKSKGANAKGEKAQHRKPKTPATTN